MKIRPVLPFFLSLLLLSGPVLCHAQAETVLLQFDASQLPAEEVASEDIKSASQFFDSGSQTLVHLSFSGGPPKASIKKIHLASGEQALRVKPDLPEDTSTPSGASFTLLDPGLGAQIDASRPLHIEIKFQRGYGPINLTVQNLYLHAGEYIHAALGGIGGHIEPEGTYSAYRTLYHTQRRGARPCARS